MAGRRASRRSGFVLGVENLEGRTLLSASPRPVSRAAEVSALRQGSFGATTSSRWAWLANTYWYVPAANLPAEVFDPTTGRLVQVPDQTVYHITGFRNGYFWGTTVTQVGNGTPTSSALVGSVTPQGRLLLNFTSPTGVIQGYGVMNRQHGRWTMENQMFTTASSGAQVGHWAYMVQTRRGMASWSSLPSVGVSVPTFLANYSGPVPTPA